MSTVSTITSFYFPNTRLRAHIPIAYLKVHTQRKNITLSIKEGDVFINKTIRIDEDPFLLMMIKNLFTSFKNIKEITFSVKREDGFIPSNNYKLKNAFVSYTPINEDNFITLHWVDIDTNYTYDFDIYHKSLEAIERSFSFGALEKLKEDLHKRNIPSYLTETGISDINNIRRALRTVIKPKVQISSEDYRGPLPTLPQLKGERIL